MPTLYVRKSTFRDSALDVLLPDKLLESDDAFLYLGLIEVRNDLEALPEDQYTLVVVNAHCELPMDLYGRVLLSLLGRNLYDEIMSDARPAIRIPPAGLPSSDPARRGLPLIIGDKAYRWIRQRIEEDFSRDQ